MEFLEGVISEKMCITGNTHRWVTNINYFPISQKRFPRNFQIINPSKWLTDKIWSNNATRRTFSQSENASMADNKGLKIICRVVSPAVHSFQKLIHRVLWTRKADKVEKLGQRKIIRVKASSSSREGHSSRRHNIPYSMANCIVERFYVMAPWPKKVNLANYGDSGVAYEREGSILNGAD